MTRPCQSYLYVPTEIARLQNSLKHLKQTQDELHSFAREDPEDEDIKQAVDENESTMYGQDTQLKRRGLMDSARSGSQEERITMLKLALVEKGVILPSSHYTLPGERANAGLQRARGSSAPAEGSLASLMQDEEIPEPVSAPAEEEEDGGIGISL